LANGPAPIKLFHFSDDPAITEFVPRTVRIPPVRKPGLEWLNHPLVWAIDEAHDFLYLFPRECPRIVIWRGDETTKDDADTWLKGHHAVAFIEDIWLERMKAAQIYRYELPPDTFHCLNDAGMWVSTQAVTPISQATIPELEAQLAARGVCLIARQNLALLKPLWETSLKASGLRLRNALSWV
jgi:hypothetical protein